MGKKKSPGAADTAARAKQVSDDGQQHNGAPGQAQPQTLCGDLRRLPAGLAPLVKLPNWVLWRWQQAKAGKWTKVPYQPNGTNAKTNDQTTWASYADVMANVEKFAGIGFCLLGTEIAAFDIDDCRDPDTGTIDPWAADLVNKVGSYTEITVSGTGLRIIGYGTGPEVHRKQSVANGVTLEAYRGAKRYIIITGNPLPGTTQEIVNIDAHIDATVAELDAKKKKKTKSTSGDKSQLPQNLRLMLHIQGEKPNVGGYPTRSELFWAFICEALRRGIDENVIVSACLDTQYQDNAIFEHVQENGGEDYVKKQIERALNEIPDTDEKGRTIIVIKEGKLDQAWRATEQALIAHGCPVYVHGGRLIQPLWRWEKAADGRDVLTARFEPINVPRLADITAHHAVQFQKFDGRTKRIKDIDPPDNLIERIIEIKHWAFPTVVGIVNAPIMRADGSLLTEQGYDRQTQLWYKSSGDVVLPPIPDRPTRGDALAALATLNELLKDFPFEQKEGETVQCSVARSVALAGFMTTVLRGALPAAAPAFLVVANEARTGKTYLVSLITVLATGHIPISTAGATEDNPTEIEKRIETATLMGRPILHFNNLPTGMTVESARLSELITEGWVTIRKLGRHEEAVCDCRATTVFLNGNNIRVAGDLVPRTLMCRLNAKIEEPETRQFKFDPIEAVRSNRGKYLAAVFTIARAFIAAKHPRPEKMHSVAGFEVWSRLVQQPLLWLGMTDPFANIEAMRAMDPTIEELISLHNELKTAFKNGDKFTVADCKRKAEEQRGGATGPYYSHQGLRELMTFHGKINERSFGRLLGKHLERIKDGWYYKPAGKVQGSAAYMLVGPPGTGSTPSEAAF